MCRAAKSFLMNAAIGLSSTNAVRTLTGRPRNEEIDATFVSADVASIVYRWLLWTGWPWSGVRRTPMLVGTTIAQVALLRSCIALSPSFRRMAALSPGQAG